MAKRKPPDPKLDALRRQGCLHPHPETVRDEHFVSSDFFDARDLVQVKYEMLRRVRIDGQTISRTAAAFGVSRPTLYQAQAAFGDGGLAALVPKKPGPRRAHKLGEAQMDFLQQALAENPTLGATELARRLEQRFGLSIHRRSVERALRRRKKKRL